MKIVYDRINDMRGNLITVTADDVALGELARIDLKDGRKVYASVLRIEGIASDSAGIPKYARYFHRR